MPNDVWLAIVTGVLGLLTAGILALVNNWIGTRAGMDENLRAQRLELYPALWKATEVVSRWPRTDLTRGTLQDLHQILRSWYYSKGGLFLSESARARYGDVQELIAAQLQHDGDPADTLVQDKYTDLMDTASALRTALTEDLDTRRRKSLWETRRRTHWHTAATRKARARVKAARGPEQVYLRHGADPVETVDLAGRFARRG